MGKHIVAPSAGSVWFNQTVFYCFIKDSLNDYLGQIRRLCDLFCIAAWDFFERI